ncbi:MAG: glycosyltransferase, partial [Pleurocapsa sp.]
VNLTNMDGMEWWRKKWNALEKSWLYINERCAVWFSNYLIADHPQIKNYLRTEVKTSKPIAVIPYSTSLVTGADKTLLEKYDLVPKKYGLVIARPEPENSILEIVSAFSQHKRNMPLVVLGNYSPEENAYHKEVLEVASEEVMFVGGIYDQEVVKALRYYTSLYFHGHQVGGTNPSLIEAMSAGSPVLAQDNPFNAWVAGEGAAYFKDAAECDQKLTQLLDNELKLQAMGKSSLDRYYAEFADDKDLKAHEELFLSVIDGKKQLSINQTEPLKAKSIA